LQVKGIVIEGANFDDSGSLILQGRQPKRKRYRCPVCGRKAYFYDKGRGKRQWRHLDMGSTKVFIESESSRVSCPKHGVLTEKVDWARHNSGFTYDFENTVAWLTLHSTMSTIACLMRIAWNTVGAIVKRVHEEIREKRGSLFNGLRRIGIDETSYKKGHKYMTVIVNHDTGGLIWAKAGYGKAVLEEFFQNLTEEQREGIEQVSADGAGWIAETVEKWCKNAQRCIDPFHVVQWANGKLDEVRRTAWQEAKREVRNKNTKTPRGRPRKGTEKKKKGEAETIKGARYPLSKNPENLKGSQQATLEMISKSNPKLFRGYLLKEKLRLVFQHPFAKAKEELEEWLAWAQRCRIPQFVELREKIKRHFEAILSSVKFGLSNARIEAINNKIKVSIRMAYGFRNIENMLALVMLRCSGVNLTLPGRA
jgi:transposase